MTNKQVSNYKVMCSDQESPSKKLSLRNLRLFTHNACAEVGLYHKL